MKRFWVHSVVLSTLLFSSAGSYAEDFVLTLKNNQFAPRVLTIPANQKVRVIVKNQDMTPAEFESTDLNREKIVAPNSEIIIFVGPLDGGTYAYFDDFHRDKAIGTIVAK